MNLVVGATGNVGGQQVRETAGTDASILPSLMLCQTRGDEIEPAPDWLRPETTVADYLRGALG